MVRTKICCIASEEELRLAVEAGASAVGLVAGMATPEGPLGEDRLAALAERTPPGVSCFLLTDRLDAAGILDHVAQIGVDVVQICDHVDPAVIAQVRSGSAARVVQVVHVGAEDSLAYAQQAAAQAHALLLDSGVPGAAFTELGGTGRTHDWGRSAAIVAASPVPVWLAGGLHAANVGQAIARVRPFGVDLCTGVRTQGRLDPAKLGAFLAAVAGS